MDFGTDLSRSVPKNRVDLRYSFVKTFLGGAQRNKILKSYVRDTIRKNERSEGLSESGASQ